MGRLRVRFAGPEWLHATGHATPDGTDVAGGHPRSAMLPSAHEFEADPGGVAVAVAPELAGRLRRLAAGRRAHVGLFSSRCCATVPTGELAVHWVDATVPTGDLETVFLGVADGVRVSTDRVLLPILAAGRPALVLAGDRHLAIRLGRPEAWLAFLDGGVAS